MYVDVDGNGGAGLVPPGPDRGIPGRIAGEGKVQRAPGVDASEFVDIELVTRDRQHEHE